MNLQLSSKLSGPWTWHGLFFVAGILLSALSSQIVSVKSCPDCAAQEPELGSSSASQEAAADGRKAKSVREVVLIVEG